MRTRWLVLALSAVTLSAYADRDRADLLSDAAEHSEVGDHPSAIDVYEYVYARDADLDLLVKIGGEYSLDGKPLDAIRYYCTYLTLEPAGADAPVARQEVQSLQAQIGNSVPANNVCAPGTPMIIMQPPLATPSPTTPSLTAPLVPQASPSKTREHLGLGVAGLGAIGLGVGVYFGFLANDISEQIDNHDNSSPWPENIKELESRGQRYESRELTFLAGGALALVGGGVLYFTGRADRISHEHVSVTPTVSKTGSGIALGGSF